MNDTVETLSNILTEYKSERLSIQTHIDPLIKKIRVLDEKISHYQKLIALEGGDSNAEPIIKIDHRVPLMVRTSSKPPTISSTVKSFIEKQDGEYTIKDIEALFVQRFPGKTWTRNNFHTVVNKMIDEGTVKLIRKGAGKYPACYLNIKQGSLL